MQDKKIMDIINLHSIEKRLFDINNKRGDLPGKISNLGKEIEIYTNYQEEDSQRIVDITKRKVILNGDLTDIEKKINTLNEQMYKVKSNKEYEALLSEIDHLNSKNNNNIIELDSFDNEVSEINEKVESNDEKLGSLNGQLLKLEKQLEEANLLIKNEEKELIKNKKDCLANKIDQGLLSLYEDKKKEYDGLAFAKVSKNCCGNCYSSLPPQLIIDIENQSELVVCPSCSILLYVDIKLSE